MGESGGGGKMLRKQVSLCNKICSKPHIAYVVHHYISNKKEIKCYFNSDALRKVGGRLLENEKKKQNKDKKKTE